MTPCSLSHPLGFFLVSLSLPPFFLQGAVYCVILLLLKVMNHQFPYQPHKVKILFPGAWRKCFRLGLGLVIESKLGGGQILVQWGGAGDPSITAPSIFLVSVSQGCAKGQ